MGLSSQLVGAMQWHVIRANNLHGQKNTLWQEGKLYCGTTCCIFMLVHSKKAIQLTDCTFQQNQKALSELRCNFRTGDRKKLWAFIELSQSIIVHSRDPNPLSKLKGTELLLSLCFPQSSVMLVLRCPLVDITFWQSPYQNGITKSHTALLLWAIVVLLHGFLGKNKHCLCMSICSHDGGGIGVCLIVCWGGGVSPALLAYNKQSPHTTAIR